MSENISLHLLPTFAKAKITKGTVLAAVKYAVAARCC